MRVICGLLRAVGKQRYVPLHIVTGRIADLEHVHEHEHTRHVSRLRRI